MLCVYYFILFCSNGCIYFCICTNAIYSLQVQFLRSGRFSTVNGKGLFGNRSQYEWFVRFVYSSENRPRHDLKAYLILLLAEAHSLMMRCWLMRTMPIRGIIIITQLKFHANVCILERASKCCCCWRIYFVRLLHFIVIMLWLLHNVYKCTIRRKEKKIVYNIQVFCS